MAATLGLVALIEREQCTDHGGDREDEQQRGGGDGSTDCSAMLTELLADDRVLGGAPHRRGDLREQVDQSAIAALQLWLIPRPRRVHPAWFTIERAPQWSWNRRRVHRPVVVFEVPRARPVGEHHEQLVTAAVLHPPFDFADDPR